MNVLADLRRPDSAVLTLHTLTPLYTGGIGQHGDQIHPSGLLGGLRRFSCLLAAAMGDGDFETRVWGSTADDRHAKRVALRWDQTGLGYPISLPSPIKLEHPGNHRGWYYNVAYVGHLGLTITRRGIDNIDDWSILLQALRIQLQWATFGSRDQWGLGVLAADTLPAVNPLHDVMANPLDQPGLHRAFFARLEFDRPAPEPWHDTLEQGLRWRAHLRGSFRNSDEDMLRHYLFGELNRWGGAVNVSALYPLDAERCALRIWGVVPHTRPPQFAGQRAEIVQRLRDALQQDVSGATPARASRLIWEDGGAQTDLPTWLNRMAGV